MPHEKALEDRKIGRPTSNSIVLDDSFPSIDHNIVTLFYQ